MTDRPGLDSGSFNYLSFLSLWFPQLRNGNDITYTTRPASWETYIQVRKQQLELDMEQQTGSK